MTFHLWFIYALLSCLTMAGSELSQKISLTQKVNISAITNNFFVWTLQGFGGLFIAILFNQISLFLNLTQVITLIAVSLTYFAAGTIFYTSFKGNSASISIILNNISVIISTILGVIFFSESTMPMKLVGLLLVIVAIFIANYKKSEKFSIYNLYAILGGALFGLAYTFDKSLSLTIPPAMYVALLCFSVALVSLIFTGKHIAQETKRMSLKNFYPIFSSATFGTLFNFFAFASYRAGGGVGVVNAITNSSIFPLIFLEIMLLNDKIELKKKIIGASIGIAGIVILSQLS